MNPFSKRVSELLPNQVHKRAIEVDAHLRVKGAPLGTVYAIGDASTIETSIVSYLLELVDEADKNKDGKIDYDEWEIMGTYFDVSLLARMLTGGCSPTHQETHPDGGGPAPEGPGTV